MAVYELKQYKMVNTRVRVDGAANGEAKYYTDVVTTSGVLDLSARTFVPTKIGAVFEYKNANNAQSRVSLMPLNSKTPQWQYTAINGNHPELYRSGYFAFDSEGNYTEERFIRDEFKGTADIYRADYPTLYATFLASIVNGERFLGTLVCTDTNFDMDSPHLHLHWLTETEGKEAGHEIENEMLVYFDFSSPVSEETTPPLRIDPFSMLMGWLGGSWVLGRKGKGGTA